MQIQTTNARERREEIKGEAAQKVTAGPTVAVEKPTHRSESNLKDIHATAADRAKVVGEAVRFKYGNSPDAVAVANALEAEVKHHAVSLGGSKTQFKGQSTETSQGNEIKGALKQPKSNNLAIGALGIEQAEPLTIPLSEQIGISNQIGGRLGRRISGKIENPLPLTEENRLEPTRSVEALAHAISGRTARASSGPEALDLRRTGDRGLGKLTRDHYFDRDLSQLSLTASTQPDSALVDRHNLQLTGKARPGPHYNN